ncbi:hypothetical protein [Streptomyces sp. NBC_00443]|uniref:hypothetical protein n=1 Tax=Streptomyces sp. NBC_00443 TaxID=2975743 RepID=UPI002E1DD8A4
MSRTCRTAASPIAWVAVRTPARCRWRTASLYAPVGSVPFSRADRRAHFGPAWPRLKRAKRSYDPRGVLVPGQGILPVG